MTTIYMRNPYLTPKARRPNSNRPKRLKQGDRKWPMTEGGQALLSCLHPLRVGPVHATLTNFIVDISNHSPILMQLADRVEKREKLGDVRWLVRFKGDNGKRRSWVVVPIVVVGLAEEKENVQEERERKKRG
ncbi:hypothetical protein MTR_1g045680 [Medicago truncatula]|uniref:Uncharacterized protein n=1 Tax=Medicago truncatula TaxID=3880 RepID=G7I6Q1_MEDTR|nr:hypothetical protein MTR_1g045680 [Medicago truncatula]